MGLFHKQKEKKNAADWHDALRAEPRFYTKPDGTPFGAIALTENTKTVLPKAPQQAYAVDGRPVPEWRLVLISPSRGGVMGDVDYAAALRTLARKAMDATETEMLVRPLSAEELAQLKN